jgi:hypothetical protein
VAAIVGGEERDDFGDFVGGAEAAHGNATYHGGFELGVFFRVRSNSI